MQVTLKMRGIKDEETALATQFVAGTGLIKIIQKPQRIRVGPIRGAESLEIKRVEADDPVAVELTGGLKLWMRVDDLRRDFGVSVSRDAGTGVDVWEIDPVLRGRGGERGALGIAIESLEFVGVDVAGKTAFELAQWFEGKQLDAAGPGIYRVDLAASAFSMSLAPDVLPAADGPVLVFLHGTASSTGGSFGKLWLRDNAKGREALGTLTGKYGERVYALEHRSLTLSPIDNALELARRLPVGAELHLVSHSRGGLVGELLCMAHRADGGAVDWERFKDVFSEDRTQADKMGFRKARPEGYPEQWERLLELAAMLEQKRVRVTRFVRVACPSRGTTLASGRLDRWLSILGYIAGDGIVGDLVNFILAVVKKKTDPRTLPGLEAMMPGSALVRLLNQPGLNVAADLSVISGDIEGDSLLGRLKLALTDMFYGGDHDLVVNTGSMYGGLPRAKDGARFYFGRGPEISHFNYFLNKDTVEKLQAGLMRLDGSLGGFIPIERAKQAEPPRAPLALRGAQGPRPLAFVLPGIMGSHLQVSGERVWLDYKEMMKGGIERLEIEDQGIQPERPIEKYYDRFIEYLGRSHEVVAFPYDWRKSVVECADLLAAAIEKHLPAQESARQPIRIVAHSMGGLVARAMIAKRKDLWDRMCKLEGCRLIMLGTPNAGSYQAVRLVVGQHKLANMLALVDFGHGRDEMLDIISRYPGAAELLPATGGRDFGSPQLWEQWRKETGETWPIPARDALDKARMTWELLRASPIDRERMIYVAGWAWQTACDCAVVKEDDLFLGELTSLRFYTTHKGDGTVPWALGRLPGVRTWYVEAAEHDQLLAHEQAFPAYLDLLQTGRTARLADTEPVVSRTLSEAEDRGIMPPDVPPYFPAESDFGGFGSGWGEPDAGRRKRAFDVKVIIRHGDLAYAHHPVCVGHYLGDTVVSAESQLDRGLGGALKRQLRMGLYPGRLGTWKVFIHPDKAAKPAGAIVIGLGMVGELSPGGLESAIAHAVMDYAMEVADWHDDRFGPVKTTRSACVSFLLVGTGFGGISVRDSVEAILRAVKKANDRLVSCGMDDKVLVDKIELLELYQDVAIQAARALEDVLRDGELGSCFVWSSRGVESGDGGQRRVMYDDAPSWWHRLEISLDRKKGELRFIALTNRARAEESLVSGQMRLADDFIREAVGKTANDREVARTLFEMLIPNRLKELAPDRYDLVLLVDEVSARYPWELLEDRWSGGRPPLAAAAGMVRQLKTPVFRAHPAHSAENTAYVVGNPKLPVMPGEPVFPDLPGARAEAVEVERVLSGGGFSVKSRIDADADDIMIGLHGDAYRVLHLAGHGVHEWETEYEDGSVSPYPACDQQVPKPKRKVSGMVIGAGVYLTPGDVEQMRWVPELVFINCCHLGSAATGDPAYSRYNLLAANVAIQFIRMGVKAVIAAGWAVNDGAAKAFATRFYQEMLRGAPFGKAVLAARREIHENFPQANTWGAYQCYGDPDYHLAEGAGSGASKTAAPYFSPLELIADLDNLTATARMGNGDKGRIDTILKRIPADQGTAWLDRAEVCTALGLAYGEFGQFEQAIAELDAAVAKEKADLPLRALEQRANFKARWASGLASDEKTGNKWEQAVKLFGEARAELEKLLSIAPTSERHNLLASTHKRMAWVTSGQQRSDALDAMALNYRKADELYRKHHPGKLDTYPLLNSRLAEVLRGQDVDVPGVVAACREAGEYAQAMDTESPNFWNSITIPESRLIRALAEGVLAKHETEIVAAYRVAKGQRGSAREFRSVLDQIEFLLAVAQDNKKLRKQRPAIAEILARLKEMAME